VLPRPGREPPQEFESPLRSGDQLESTSREGPQDVEVAVIERQNLAGVKAIGQHDDRCVGDAETSVTDSGRLGLENRWGRKWPNCLTSFPRIALSFCGKPPGENLRSKERCWNRPTIWEAVSHRDGTK
jgi:hypothetical protein